MTRPVRALLLLLIATASLEAMPRQGPSAPGRVVMAVAAWDRSGRPVQDLVATDFDLRDNGKLVSDVSVTPAAPVALGVLYTFDAQLDIDVTTSLAAIRGLIEEMAPDDRLSVASATSEASILSPPNLIAISALAPGLSREENPLDRLAGLANGLARWSSGRVIVVISTEQVRPLLPQRASLGDVQRRVQDAGVLVHSLHLGPGRPHRGVERVVNTTGGVNIRVDVAAGVSQELRLAVARMRAAYMLAFRPVSADGKTHRLDLRGPSGVTVRGRREYVAHASRVGGS